MRAIRIAVLVMILSTAASADVVILESNDIPLTGTILSETDSSIEFQLKGLGDRSSFTIEKSRIKRFWREDSDHWEFKASEKAHAEAAERVRKRKIEKANPHEVLTFEIPDHASASRSNRQVRADLIARTVDRLTNWIPESLPMQALLALGGVLVLTLLVFIGGKVADLPSLSIQKSMLLSFMAGLAVLALTEVLPRLELPAGLLPALILGVTLAWLVAARLLSKGRFVKGAIMLSFVVATLFIAGSSLIGILAVV